MEMMREKMNIEHRTSNIEPWMGKDEETVEGLRKIPTETALFYGANKFRPTTAYFDFRL